LNNRKLKVGVIYGGWSNEREISIRSGNNVIQALKNKNYEVVPIDMNKDIADILRKEKIDVAYIILHGAPGEDGSIQGLLELMNIPYTGSGILGSAIALNKIVSKQLFTANNIPTLPYVAVRKNDVISNSLLNKINNLGYPLIVKAYAEGSSIGVVKVDSSEELENMLPDFIEKYKAAVIEKFVKGKDITIGILETKSEIIALPILELRAKNEFYDYEAKYTKGMTEFVLPAELPDDITERAKKIAIEAHKALWCYGVSRVDMIVNNNDLYVLEVNTLPGMTTTSDLPAQAENFGIGFDDLVEKILLSGLEAERL
jgi:D-alanine-D-alanine ligase